jgi:hypothetical protein
LDFGFWILDFADARLSLFPDGLAQQAGFRFNPKFKIA